MFKLVVSPALPVSTRCRSRDECMLLVFTTLPLLCIIVIANRKSKNMVGLGMRLGMQHLPTTFLLAWYCVMFGWTHLFWYHIPLLEIYGQWLAGELEVVASQLAPA